MALFGSQRSVAVKLEADVRGYVASVRSAGKATEDFAKSAGQSARKHKTDWNEVGTGMLAVGAAIGAGVGLAVKAFADFDKEMSGVRAVSGATAGQMQQLRTAALEAGAATSFSASEAAQATKELAKVGINTADILGGALRGALDLAAAGNLDLARAAEISGQAMKIFKLNGQDVPRIADALANGANKSAADVEDLAQALNQAGLVSAQTGLDLEDTVGTLALFADNALRGSDAGTSLRTMLLRLNPASDEAAELMEQLGLKFYDAQGQFIGIEKTAGLLQSRLGSLSTEQRNAALQTIFGQDAIRGANVLIEAGAEGLREYVKEMGRQGEAARVAAIQLDNLAGDWEAFGGSVETALINSGGALNDFLRDVTQAGTAAVNLFNGLPGPVQEAALVTAALTSAILLLGGTAALTVPKVLALDASLKTATGGAVGLRTAMSTLLPALAAVGVAFAAVELSKWAAEAGVADVEVRRLAGSLGDLDRDSGAFQDLFESDAPLAWRDSIKSADDALKAFGTSAQVALGRNFGDQLERFLGGSGSVAAFEKQIGQLDAAMASMVQDGNIDGAADAYDRLMGAIEAANKAGANIPVDEVAAKFTEYQAALDASREAAQNAEPATEELGLAMQGTGESAEEARKKVDDLIQSLASAGLVQLSARDAARAWEQSLDDLTASIEENGTTLDITTQAGRDNQAALDAVAKAAINQAQAVYDATGNENKFRDTLLKSRPALIEAAKKFNLSDEAAAAYADTVLNIPAVKSTSFTTPGLDGARRAVADYRRDIINLPNGHTTTITTRYVTSGTNPYATRAGQAVGYATGGSVTGPGTATSDSIPALLSNGEHVWTAAEVKAAGGHAAVAALREFALTGAAVPYQRFASGGPVRASTPMPTVGASGGSGVVSLDNATLWRLADAVSRVQLSMDGHAVAKNTQSRQDFMMRSGG